MTPPSPADGAATASLLAAALDQVDEGAAILDEHGRPIYANAAFRASGAATGPAAGDDAECLGLDDGSTVVTIRAGAREEELYREILDRLDESIAAYDEEERYLYGNRAFHERHPHLPPDVDIVGTGFPAMLQRAMRAGQAFDAQALSDLDGYLARRLEEFRSTAPGASERLTLSGRWNLLRLRVMSRGHRVTLRTDITEQKRIQEDLRRTRERLETEDATRAAFVAKLSHELRTPLTAVLGYGEMIENEALGPIGPARYREYAGQIVQSGRRLLGLVDRILELSRLEAGRVEMSETAIDLVDLLRREIATVEPAARENGTLLALNLPGRFPALHGDVRLVRQMLVDLLSNAVRYTVRGTVALSLRRRADDGIDLLVSDDGVGMPPEVLARLGESYYRGPLAPAGGDGGPGLGLAVVKQLAALHQGRLTIESTPGRGTVAILGFPPERTLGA